jgi:protein SCO1/2
MIRYIAWAAVCVVTAVLTVTWLLGQKGRGSADQFAQCRSSAVATGTQIGGPFELVNAQGQTVTDADVIKEPTLIYFGYTFCPDVCPLDNARNAEAVDLLSAKGISATPVFISIDPERDTPEVMAEFIELFHDKMIGLTGSLEQVDAVSKAYKTYYKKQPGDPEFYLVDHSVFTYLVLPEHGFVEFFRRDATADQVAETTQCFSERA